jgi:hypothetical protein
MSIYNQTVTRVRAVQTGLDDQNNPVRSWADDADRVTYTNVAVDPTSSTEANNTADMRDQVFTGYRVATRRGLDMDVLVTDRIEWRGRQWEVAAEPERPPHPVSPNRVHHCAVQIQFVEA